jgi:GNAT superfamily N-acetyltransferase
METTHIITPSLPPSEDYVIRLVSADEIELMSLALGNILLECVKEGVSIGFMNNTSLEEAAQFWSSLAHRVRNNEVVTLGCFGRDDVSGHSDLSIVGTVSLEIKMPPNQPHRANIMKLQVHPSHRGKGIAKRLMKRIEELAKYTHNRTLLVLDSMSLSDAAKMYPTMGYEKVGEIPNFSMFPDGSLGATTIFYKAL